MFYNWQQRSLESVGFLQGIKILLVCVRVPAYVEAGSWYHTPFFSHSVTMFFKLYNFFMIVHAHIWVHITASTRRSEENLWLSVFAFYPGFQGQTSNHFCDKLLQHVCHPAFLSLHLSFGDSVFHWTWNSLIQQWDPRLTSEEPPVSTSSAFGVPDVFIWEPRIKLGSSCL